MVMHDHEPLTFTYTNECISGLVSSPIEKIIPLETGEINSPAVHAYFENLLPEGDQRNSLEKRHHVTSIFGLLETSAWDSAGSLVLIPTGTAPHDPEYVKTTWPEIAQIISGQLERHDRPKTTISGAQYKILLIKLTAILFCQLVQRHQAIFLNQIFSGLAKKFGHQQLMKQS
jgi:serine/threonine-protein kinase HipA